MVSGPGPDSEVTVFSLEDVMANEGLRVTMEHVTQQLGRIMERVRSNAPAAEIHDKLLDVKRVLEKMSPAAEVILPDVPNDGRLDRPWPPTVAGPEPWASGCAPTGSKQKA